MEIEEIARSKLVEELVQNTAKGRNEDPDDLNDLVQDIYVLLLEKASLVTPLNEKETRYFIARLVTNNIKSKTSRYYYKYKKDKKEKLLPLEAWAKKEEDDKNNNDV